MKKVLIISYFYPPANFVGGERTASWAKYLPEHGFYPIIVTRQWNQNQTDLIDKVENNELEIEYNSSHEVHRLHYKRSLRDRCSEYKWLKPLQKFLTLYELIASNFSIRALPYSNFYSYCKQLIKENSDISIVIASGRPFQSFFIGHKLKKEFPSIHWVPDYRDEWTTFQHNHSRPLSEKLLHPLAKRSERKWLSSASKFITVSEYWSKSIQSFVEKEGVVVLNGFKPNEKLPEKNDLNKIIVINYVGTLYPNQKIEVLLDAAVQIKDYEVLIQFFGTEMNAGQNNRIQKYSDKLDIKLNPRIPKAELLVKLANTDLFVLTGFEDVKGWYPVKLFEYFNLNRPILLCPSDNDVMEKFIRETNSGYIANTKEECTTLLKFLIQKKQNNESLMPQRNESAAKQYTRQNQTKVLADALDELSQAK